jgi:4-hydroxybenzoate polyprenyltransferase
MERSAELPADAIARSWVNTTPRAAQPWLRLMRLDRPIGVELLFLPCLFGLALGALVQHRGFGALRDLELVALFLAGAVVMRGAGCTYNDIVDRDIDAQVARTRGRPLPSGAVSLRGAWIFLALQCAAGLGVLLQFNLCSVALGAGSLVLVALYPYMKRITWWPQAWLGLTFNWGALLGFSAITGHLAPPAVLLYAGCFFWTLGYDTIYAHQDKDDDALIGVKSTARLLEHKSRPFIAAAYALTLGCTAAALVLAGARAWIALLLAPAALHLFWQVRTLDVNDSPRCLTIFRANRDAGLLVAAALLVAGYIG